MEQPPEFLKKLEAFADRMKRSAFQQKDQPISPFGTAYGSFPRRMIAAGLDTLVLTLTVFPLSYYVTNALVGKVDMDMTPLITALQQVGDPAMRAQIIQQFLVEEGRLDYFYTNTMVQLAGLFVYCMVCWRYWAATPGKMVVRLQVLDEKTGACLGYMQGFWRCVGYIIGSVVLCLGIIWLSFDKRRQGWHDKLCGSVVIVKPKPNTANN